MERSLVKCLPTTAARVRRALLLSSFGLLLATGARAGTLTSASWFQVVEGVPMTRTSSQLIATGSSTSTSVSVQLTYPFLATTVLDPVTPNFDRLIHITQGGVQSLVATPSHATGTPAIGGTVVANTAPGDMFSLLRYPLAAGKAGLFHGTFTVLGNLHDVTVDFYAWTPHTLIFTGLTSNGAALPDVTAAGSFGLGAQGGGTVTLVSPTKLSIDGLLVQRRTASITTLTLHFVPEPGALLLLAGAALALGHRRLRS